MQPHSAAHAHTVELMGNNLPTQIQQMTSLIKDFKVKLVRYSFKYDYLNTASRKSSFYFLQFVPILFVVGKIGSSNIKY